MRDFFDPNYYGHSGLRFRLDLIRAAFSRKPLYHRCEWEWLSYVNRWECDELHRQGVEL